MGKVFIFLISLIIFIIVVLFVSKKDTNIRANGYYIDEDNRSSFIIINENKVDYNGEKGIIRYLNKKSNDFEIILKDAYYYGYYGDYKISIYNSKSDNETARIINFKLSNIPGGNKNETN